MAGLTAIFKAVDQMSAVMDKMSDAGTAALNQWERSADAVDQAFSDAVDSTEQLFRTIEGSDCFSDITDDAEEFASSMDDAIRRTEEFRDSNSQLAKELDRLQDAYIGTVLESGKNSDQAKELKGEIDELTKALQKQEKELKDLEDAAGKTGDSGTDAIDGLAGALTSAGIAVMVNEVAQAFVDAGEAAAEFETCLAKVSSIADPAQASLRTISGELTSLSMDAGKAVTELSEAAYEAISSGVQTADSVSFAGDATKLAVGGFTDAATAVDVLTTSINAYGLEASDATEISDMLIATQNLGKTTVDELATNLGRVIPLAAAYGVEMDNLSTAYSIMTSSGIATAETTTYIKSMLSELGTTSSDVSKVLMTETGMTFAELSDAGYSLGDVLEVLGNSVDGNTTAFNELWSSQEAGVGALSLYNAGAEKFTSVLDAMQDSAGATSRAYETMTDTTEHSAQRLQNSFNNLQISVGTVLNPTFRLFNETVADGVDALTGFINEHPAVVAALTAAATAVGVVTVGVVGYTAAKAAAVPVITAFTAAMSASIWPITLAVAGVSALAAGAAVLVNWLKSEDDEFNALDATSKQYTESLDQLNAKHEEAISLYGENSAQVQELEQEIATMEAQLDSTSGTMEDFISKNDALLESHDKLISSYQSSDSALFQEDKTTAALIGKLDQLSGKTNLTAGEQEQMAAIITKLNKQVPDLALHYDAATGALNKSASAIRAMAEAEAEEQRRMADYETYINLLADRADLQEQLTKATDQTAAAYERYEKASAWDKTWNIGGVRSDLEAFTEEQIRLQDALAETDSLIAEHESAWEELKEETENVSLSYEEGVARAISTVKDELEALATKYDEAWQAARDSIGSQIGLFDEMATETELSISDMTNAMQSQIDYLNTYSENLRLAAEYGLNEGLIAALSDGSAESAGYVNAIISEIERLGGTTAGLSGEAVAFVESFNAQYEGVEAAKDSFATTVTTMEEDFNTSMNGIVEDLDQAIDSMNMEADAEAAARATIDAYVNAILSGVDAAAGAAAAVSSATNLALSNPSALLPAEYDLSGIDLNGALATGTESAERGAYLVGEEGPELVYFNGGETVLNADDTRQYLADTRPIQTAVPAFDADAGDDNSGSTLAGERRIVLELAGHGSLELSGGNVDADAAAEWLADNLRPMLIRTLKQEIFEEGDVTYAY